MRLRPFAVLMFALGTGALLPFFGLDVDKDIIERSKTYIGCRYRSGGVQPDEFDCSGFVGYILRPIVPGLPRLSRDMADFGVPVGREDLRPGDIVFFATTSVAGAISHVALYIGDGKIIHAISDGPETGVRITDLDARYWRTHYERAARVLPPDDSPKVAAPAPTVTAAGTAGAQAQRPASAATSKTAAPSAAPVKTATASPAVSGTANPVKTAAQSAPAPAPAPTVTAAGTAGAQAQRSASAATPKTAAPSAAPVKTATASPAPASPWDSWNGYISGDYAQWKATEQSGFDASKKAYDRTGETADFEAWKKAHGE